MSDGRYELRVIGRVESPLSDAAEAPRQGDEGAPAAWIACAPALRDALEGLREGEYVFVLTWLHQADRDILRVHPRGDATRPVQGVFSTRSPTRPNPIGLHRVRIVAMNGTRLLVEPLEAIAGTPVIDIKPLLDSEGSAR